MDEQFSKKPWVAPIRTLESNNPTLTSNDNSSDKKILHAKVNCLLSVSIINFFYLSTFYVCVLRKNVYIMRTFPR